MRLAEVERIEGVWQGLIGLIWLWKCVEKLKGTRVAADRDADRPRGRAGGYCGCQAVGCGCGHRGGGAVEFHGVGGGRR